MIKILNQKILFTQYFIKFRKGIPSMGSSNEHSMIEARDSTLVEYEDTILAAKDLIDSALMENLHRPTRPIRRATVIRVVEEALRAKDDSEDLHAVAHAILSIIGTFNIDSFERFEDLGASPELVEFFTEMSSKYGHESQVPNYIEHQGPDFWHGISPEIVKRSSSGKIGVNYRIMIGKENRESRISVSLNSNLSFAFNLLTAELEAIEDFESEAVEQIDQSELGDIKERIDEVESLIAEHQPEEEAASSADTEEETNPGDKK